MVNANIVMLMKYSAVMTSRKSPETHQRNGFKMKKKMCTILHPYNTLQELSVYLLARRKSNVNLNNVRRMNPTVAITACK